MYFCNRSVKSLIFYPMQEIQLPGWCPEIKDVSKWVLGNIQFNVLLSGIAAINETLNAAAMLRERPDIFRQRTKQSVNLAIKKAEALKYIYMVYTINPALFDEFSDHIIDVTEKDVSRLRGIIRENVEAAGVKDADIVAWASAALMLLHLTAEHYNAVISEGNERARRVIARKRLEREMVRHDYGTWFSQHSPQGLLDAWQVAHGQITSESDALVKDDVLEQLRLISRNYGNGAYLNLCLEEMKDNPFFQNVVFSDSKSHSAE